MLALSAEDSSRPRCISRCAAGRSARACAAHNGRVCGGRAKSAPSALNSCGPEIRHAQNGFKVTSLGGTVFEDVDLRDDWVEYCDKLKESVSISAMEARFERR